MPIYEYSCTACQHQLEALQKIADEPLKDCPQCHQPALRKKISAAGFRLKGGGWYETDFKSGSRKNVAGDDAGSKPAESKPADSKKDSGGSSASGGATAATTSPA